MTSKELYTKGCRVWIGDEELIWRSAQLTSNWDENRLELEFEDGATQVLPVKDVTDLPFLRNPDILVGSNDLTALSYLHEPAVLHNLRVRFCDKNIIYTYCGIVLVAINPYESLDIYNETAVWAYRGASMGDLDPHIYAISEEAYTKMEREGRNQSIIVSGESGAGKTVSAKYAMRFFATVGGESSETRIEAKVIASNPIMEAIGNAKTTRNDNSSRFGKYIQIDFNARHMIIGAHMRTYLLEKSRVVFQADDERNYHIFYQLCAAGSAMPEWRHLRLKNSADFRYINQGQCPTIKDVDDLAMFKSFTESLSTLQFSRDDQSSMFKVIASVLHLGNICFVKGDGGSSVEFDQESFSAFCELLQLDKEKVKQALCVVRVQIGREIVTKHPKPTEASTSRDALAKHMYAVLFDWIVESVNKALGGKEKRKHFIGVLDIYGFETFQRNSFEQFCINYANEKLQQQFNQHVFKLEQEEYAREAITWSYIDFYDNQPCINLIESKLGILDLLDEECRLPKGCDEQWCQKLYTQCKKSNHFKKPKLSQEKFIVGHFAGDVDYDCHGFKEKNMDTILEDQLEMLASARLPFAAALFKKPAPSKSTSQQLSGGSQKQNKMTVGSQFRQSLNLLMETLNATTPHYVRCIKPNDDKSAFVFNPHRATQQLRACGVLETVRISAAGFPSRWTYAEFMQRYRMLATAEMLKKGDQKENCASILGFLLKDPDKFQFGRTKIFFRAGQVAYMEKLRSDKLNQAAITIQKVVKGLVYRKRYLRQINALRGIQRYGKGLLARRKAQHLRETAAVIKIQKWVRGYVARRKYERIRRLTLRLQCFGRGYLARQRFTALRENKAAVAIQKTVRGFLERRRFAKTMRKIILCQSAVRRFLAKKLRKRMKEEEKKAEHWKTQYKGLENKIISQKQEMIDLTRARDEARNRVIAVETQMKEKVRTLEELLRVANDRNKEYEERINALNEALELSRKGEMDANDKIEAMEAEIKSLKSSNKESSSVKESFVAALVTDPTHNSATMEHKWVGEKKLLVKELEELRTDYQRILEDRDHIVAKIYGDPHSSPSNTLKVHNHKRTPSDISANSDQERDEDDNGYGTVSRKNSRREDITTILKYEQRVKGLEAQKEELQKQLEYQQQLGEPSSADMIKLHELVRENAKLKASLKSMAVSEGDGHHHKEATEKTKALLDELWAELNDKKEEIRGLRDALAGEGQPMTHIPGRDEEGEIYMAFETQKTMLNQLENELRTMKMSARENELGLNTEIRQLREHNNQLQQIFSSDMSPTEKSSSFLQGEIARLSRENVDLKEKYDRAMEQIRRLKKQSKIVQHSHSEFSDTMPMIRHKTETTGSYLGMLEYKIEDETHIIRSLIIDLKPRVTQQLLPALPAYILIMMIRHIDHCNDDQKVRSLLNNVITNVRRVIKKRKDDLEHTAMWLTIMYRFFNNLRQYSGEEVYQNENTPRQNEQCLRNFDLSQYRQLISDICLLIYAQMVRSMTDKLQKLVIPAIIEHDATGGGHMHRRKSSTNDAQPGVDVAKALDMLLDELSLFNKLIQSHYVDVDVRVIMFKELFHYICASSLNNLLLRREMCHWTKGVQIRHNLSRLEHWSREQHLFGINDHLAPAIQAVQVLQARKREEDIPDVCEMAPNLTSGQLLRICQMYTPVEGYEESFSPKFISKLQEYIRKTYPKDNSKDYLIDTKARFPVRFQYIPSDVQLETITVPEVLNLHMLKRI